MNDNTSYLAFFAGAYRVLIGVDHVLEVLGGSREAVDARVRHTSWRGSVLPVLDMAHVLGCGTSGGTCYALVLHDRENEAGQRIMVRVDRLDGIVQLSFQDFSELPMHSRQLERYFDGVHLQSDSGLSTLRLRPPASWCHSALADDAMDAKADDA